MKIGDLRHRIEVFGRGKIENELGEVDYIDINIKTIWAAIIPQTAKLQTQQADTILSNTTHKIIVRYESGKDITQDMYIMFRKKRFDIKYILNPHFKNEQLEIFAEEVAE
ncbi:phage head closure protein [Marinisporobacter balticus]|uniref:SPP1 family predicted phage head-tail adaptor n=1 Tax=Marinisporobacter balticus TaxID=2018667 RepID=A0A4R2KS72_9FIRM|nr:phage head closure protein [Marinisporobacter balticus]TCO69505.1 SPP1 family predicted phage head-tail adaptor [Marinisporobacter balticus]